MTDNMNEKEKFEDAVTHYMKKHNVTRGEAQVQLRKWLY